MHPSIAEFPNKMFYAAEKLVPVPLKHQLENRLEYDMPSLDGTDDVLKQHRMLFIPSPLNLSSDVSEKANRAEARITASLLARVYRQYGSKFNPNKTVGVIVPYRNQIAMIRSEIETWRHQSLATSVYRHGREVSGKPARRHHLLVYDTAFLSNRLPDCQQFHGARAHHRPQTQRCHHASTQTTHPDRQRTHSERQHLVWSAHRLYPAKRRILSDA